MGPKRKYARDGRAPIPESEKTSEIMSKIRGKHTEPELVLRQALKEVGIPGYRLYWKKAPGRPDVTYPGKKIAIFVHGCFWHRCPHCDPPLPKTHTDFWAKKFQRNKERDAAKVRVLEADGWKVFVFWECQVREDAVGCARGVKAFVHSQVPEKF